MDEDFVGLMLFKLLFERMKKRNNNNRSLFIPIYCLLSYISSFFLFLIRGTSVKIQQNCEIYYALQMGIFIFIFYSLAFVPVPIVSFYFSFNLLRF